MSQQTLERTVLPVADAQTDGKPNGVLVRLWREAEETIAAQRPPERTQEPTAQPAKVRYAYD